MSAKGQGTHRFFIYVSIFYRQPVAGRPPHRKPYRYTGDMRISILQWLLQTQILVADLSCESN